MLILYRIKMRIKSAILGNLPTYILPLTYVPKSISFWHVCKW